MANRGNTWAVPAGEQDSFTVTVSNENGAITGQYQGTEPLPATVWRGSNLAPIAGMVTASWNTAADGTVDVVVSPDAAQAPGFYRVRLSVTFGGQTSPFYFGWIRVEAVPGTASEPAVYGSYQDLVDHCGEWVNQLQQGEAADRTDFLTERARAREWMDDAIVANSRVFAYRFDLTYALYYGSFPFGPVEAPDSVMTQYLASDFLIVKPRTIEACSYKAAAFICEKRQTFDAKGDEYQRRAAWFHRKASNSLRRYRAELDTNADGVTDIAFNLGVITMR
jgi:hypothetical protein